MGYCPLVEKNTRSPCCKSSLEMATPFFTWSLGGPVQGVAKLGIHIISKAGAVKGIGPGCAVDVGIAHILKGILYDFLSQRVGRDVTPVAIGLGNRVVVLDNHKLAET